MNFPRHPWIVDDGNANNGPESVFLGSFERETLRAIFIDISEGNLDSAMEEEATQVSILSRVLV